MTSKKAMIIAIIVVAVAIPVGIYTVSPLFISTEINEPPPTVDVKAMQQFEEFMNMSEEERMEMGHQMSSEDREMIMKGAAQSNDSAVDEQMTQAMTSGEPRTEYTGTFVGVNDGIHNADGNVKVIRLSNGTDILRLEDFSSTNGPDLYVYLSTDKSASDFVNLGRLKGNVGNQNYQIPQGTELEKYDTVLIWCQAFSVLFGSAEIYP